MEAKARSTLLDGSKTERHLIPMTKEMSDWLRNEAEKDRRPISQIVRFAIAQYAEQLEYERREVDQK